MDKKAKKALMDKTIGILLMLAAFTGILYVAEYNFAQNAATCKWAGSNTTIQTSGVSAILTAQAKATYSSVCAAQYQQYQLELAFVPFISLWIALYLVADTLIWLFRGSRKGWQ